MLLLRADLLAEIQHLDLAFGEGAHIRVIRRGGGELMGGLVSSLLWLAPIGLSEQGW